MISNYRDHKISRIIILLLLLSPAVLLGQRTREEPPPIKERLFYGGSFGLQFGTLTDIEVSPVIGFWVLPRIAFAAGPEYRFYKYYSDRTSIYGGKTYMEMIVLRNINSVIPIGSNTNIIFHLEDELLSLESSFWKNPPITEDRFYVNTILAGGGLSQQIGRRSSINFYVLFALNESLYGIYSNPEIRLSFLF
jgi:hypothetical protein